MDKSRKGNGFLLLLAPIWGLIKIIGFLLMVTIALTEIFTPSLNYFTSAPKPYRSDEPAAWIEPNAMQAQRSYRTTLLTSDYRSLQVDYFAPDNLNSSSIPLTIIVAGFMAPDWLLDKVRPHGFNAVVIYRSPRIDRINGNAFPTLMQAHSAKSFSDYWNLLASNPFNFAYNLHAGLHEAPGDIANIVRWAQTNIQADVGRINIIGLGTGSLIAAAAADGLQTAGLPPRTLVLVNPPAEMSSAIYDNLLEWPQWCRAAMSKLLSKIYFRLDLSRHLPRLNDTAKLLIIPQDAFELATYAAEPAVAMAGDNKTTVQRIDMHYRGYYDEHNVAAIRSAVSSWLTGQGAIQGY